MKRTMKKSEMKKPKWTLASLPPYKRGVLEAVLFYTCAHYDELHMFKYSEKTQKTVVALLDLLKYISDKE